MGDLPAHALRQAAQVLLESPARLRPQAVRARIVGAPDDVVLADRVIILDQGAKVFEGTPAQLTSDEQIAVRYLGVGV